MNQSVHGVDLLQWIMGPVKTVTAHASSRIHPEIEVEDTLACSLTFESGAHGVLMGTTAMWPGGNVRLEIGGENGTAVSEDGLRRWSFRDQTDEDKHLPDALRAKRTEKSTGGGSSAADVPQYLHLRNLTAIYEAWERGEEPETTAREARGRPSPSSAPCTTLPRRADNPSRWTNKTPPYCRPLAPSQRVF